MAARCKRCRSEEGCRCGSLARLLAAAHSTSRVDAGEHGAAPLRCKILRLWPYAIQTFVILQRSADRASSCFTRVPGSSNTSSSKPAALAALVVTGLLSSYRRATDTASCARPSSYGEVSGRRAARQQQQRRDQQQRPTRAEAQIEPPQTHQKANSCTA